MNSILADGIKATVLQPASQIAEMAVDQADTYVKTGSTGQPEKQSIDCTLVKCGERGVVLELRRVKA